jgi:hypothetical protein
MPSYLQTVTDPTFGNLVTRISDATTCQKKYIFVKELAEAYNILFDCSNCHLTLNLA